MKPVKSVATEGGYWLKTAMIKLTRWHEDRWTSMIGSPFRHPDKLGHFAAHFVITYLMILLGWPILYAFLSDLIINLTVEIVDGTRPRRKLSFRRHMDFVVFVSQADYEAETIEGFSIKDFLAGLIGSVAAIFLT